MSEEKPVLCLYYDEGCQSKIMQETINGKTRWALNFGRLYAGKKKSGIIYIKNVTPNKVADVEVDIFVTNHDGVFVEIAPTTLPQIDPGAVALLRLTWTAFRDAGAGPRLGRIKLSGNVLEEKYHLKI